MLGDIRYPAPGAVGRAIRDWAKCVQLGNFPSHLAGRGVDQAVYRRLLSNANPATLHSNKVMVLGSVKPSTTVSCDGVNCPPFSIRLGESR